MRLVTERRLATSAPFLSERSCTRSLVANCLHENNLCCCFQRSVTQIEGICSPFRINISIPSSPVVFNSPNVRFCGFIFVLTLLVPILKHRSRLMSKNKDLLTYLHALVTEERTTTVNYLRNRCRTVARCHRVSADGELTVTCRPSRQRAMCSLAIP